MTLYAYGRPLLIDPGRLNYRAEGRIFRSTPYHNTVTIDGDDQHDDDASFERWKSTDAYDLAVGSHRLYPGVTHRRTVLFVKPRFWVVRDDVLADGDPQIEQRWHLPEDANAKKLDGHATVTRFKNDGNLLVSPVTPIASLSIEEYKIAYRWDECVPAELCCYVPDGRHLVSLLVPFRGTTTPSVTVLSKEISPGGTDLSIRIDEQEWHLMIDPTSCKVESQTAERS